MGIENLIVRSILEELSLEEEKIVDNWLKQSEDNKIVYIKLQKIYTLFCVEKGSNINPNKFLLSKLTYELNKNKSVGKHNSKQIGVAISIAAALITISFIVFKPKDKYNNIEQQNIVAASSPSNTKIKAILSTNDSVSHVIDSLIDLTANISKREIDDDKPKISTVSVVECERFQIILDDGTVVWLNGGSSITYPNKFSEDIREVTIKGEAFFIVATNPNKPFVVNAKNVKSVVYGTQINVKAYSKSEYVETTLFEGKVKVNGVDILPGESALKRDDSSEIEVYKANLKETGSWINGEFYFENTTLEKIMEQFSLWYGKNIVFEHPEMKNEKFTIAFSRDKDLTSALRLLSNTQIIKFKIMGDEIYVDKK